MTTVELTASGKPAKEQLRYLVITNDGKSHHGTVIEDTPEAIVLRNDLRKMVVIARKNVKAVATLAREKPVWRPNSALENNRRPAAAVDPGVALRADTRYFVVTKNGRVIQGILVENTPTAIMLKTDAGRNIRIFRKDIEAVRTAGTTLATTAPAPNGKSVNLKPVDCGWSTGSADVKQIEARIEALAEQVESLRAQLKGSRGPQSTLEARAKVRVQIRVRNKNADSPDASSTASTFWIEEPLDHRLVLREMKAAEKDGQKVTEVLFMADGNRSAAIVGDLIKKLRAAGFNIVYDSTQKKK